jgi:transcriptional regulator with XRE-family HTH domain
MARMKTNPSDTPQSTNSDYADRIRLERTKRAWTQEKLAEATGVSARTIQRLECGEVPSPETLRRIAEAFGIPVEEMKAKALRKYYFIPLPLSGKIAVIGALLFLVLVGNLANTGCLDHAIVWFSLAGLAYLVLNLGWVPRSLVLRRGKLQVNKNGGWSSKYDLSKLTGIRAAPYEMLMDPMGSIPLSPIVSMGYGWSRALGYFRAYTNDYKLTVLLEFGDEKILVGPDNPEEFIESVRDEMHGVCAEGNISKENSE